MEGGNIGPANDPHATDLAWIMTEVPGAKYFPGSSYRILWAQASTNFVRMTNSKGITSHEFDTEGYYTTFYGPAGGNAIQFSAAAAGTTPRLLVLGGDANVGLNILTKGSGTLLLNGTPLPLSTTQNTWSQAQTFGNGIRVTAATSPAAVFVRWQRRSAAVLGRVRRADAPDRHRRERFLLHVPRQRQPGDAAQHRCDLVHRERQRPAPPATVHRPATSRPSTASSRPAGGRGPLRNLILAACLCAAAAPRSRSSRYSTPSPEWVAAALRALAEQRNEALDRAASLSADLDAARRELAVLKQGAARPSPRSNAATHAPPTIRRS